jgi:hypothetical protein
MEEAKIQPSPQSLDRGEFYPKVGDWIIKEFGKERYEEFSKTLPEELAHRLENADPAGWYPVQDSRLLYEKMFDFFGTQHLESYVQYYANQALKGFLRGLVAFMNPLGLARRSAALWGRFHSTGRIEVELLSRNHGTITLHDWNHSPIHCHIHRLWYAELARIAGGKNVRVEETHCVHRGDEFCRWDIQFI